MPPSWFSFSCNPRSRLLHLICLFCSLSAQTVQAQVYNSVIDVQHYGFSLLLNDDNNSIRGEAAITLRFLKDTSCFSLDLVKKNNTGKGMLVSSVTEKGHALRFLQDSQSLKIYTGSRTSSRSASGPSSATSSGTTTSSRSATTPSSRSSAPPSSTTSSDGAPLHTYTIVYHGIPADGLIISTNKFGHRTFFGDNWPNRAHNWLPCVDHPSDKATVDFRVTAPDHYEVVANGLKEKDSLLPGHYRFTHWKESVPLATKVMVIGVAAFAVDHPADVQGIPVYSYVFPENKEKGFHDYAVATRILPYYIQQIGPYAYEKLADIQSKTIFGGMENASAIFYFENSVGDKGIEPLMAHEIAHQWFGDAVTETAWQHIWLSEGFASYMTYLYMEHQYGADTLQKGMAKDRRQVIAFEKKRKTPVVDTTVTGNYMQLLNANSYQKGSWVLHMLRRRLGDSLFWKGIASYYAIYKNGNANTAGFEKCMEAAGGQNLSSFFREWLYGSGHPSLRITWNYDADKKLLDLDIEQRQDDLFGFPLEYSIDGVLYTADIAEKNTRIQVPLTTALISFLPDPNINLLADFEVSHPL